MTRKQCPQCFKPLCTRCRESHIAKHASYTECVAPDCMEQGVDCYRCGIPFCELHLEGHDCEDDDGAEDEDRGRAERIERVKIAIGHPGAGQRQEKQREGCAVEPREASWVPCPPDRYDPTSAGCPTTVEAAKKLSAAMNARAAELRPHRSIEGWPGQEAKDQVPVAQDGCYAASWGHPGRLSDEIHCLKHETKKAMDPMMSYDMGTACTLSFRGGYKPKSLTRDFAAPSSGAVDP